MNFKNTYELHKDLVYNLALHYVQNRMDAEEISQDVFLIVYEKISTFKKESSLKTWVYRITINKSLDFIKAKQANKRNFLFSAKRLDDDKVNFQPANFDHPGVIMEQKEAIEHVFKCINRLSLNQKTVVILLKIEQLSMADASEVMNISQKATESLFHRAKQKLKVFLIK